jgi:hypothetical protein
MKLKLKILAAILLLSLAALACLGSPTTTETEAPDPGPEQTITAQAEEIAKMAQKSTDEAMQVEKEATEKAQAAEDDRATASAEAESAQQTADAEAAEVTEEVVETEAVETEEPAQEEESPAPVFSFPDEFEDDRNMWGQDNIRFIEDGKYKFRDIPDNRAVWSWCESCLVSPDTPHVEIEVTGNDIDHVAGLLVDNGMCTGEAFVVLVSPYGAYLVIQASVDDDGNFQHWKPYIDWTRSSAIREGQNATNKISADYEFDADAVRFSLEINDTYITRLKAPAYTGDNCVAGVYGEGGDFDVEYFTIE